MPRKKAPLKYAAMLALPPHLQELREKYEMERRSRTTRRRYRNLRQAKSLCSSDLQSSKDTEVHTPSESDKTQPELPQIDISPDPAKTKDTTSPNDNRGIENGTDVEFSTDNYFDDDGVGFAEGLE